MGRKKIPIKKIESPYGRKVTFTKRSKGFLKKAHELSVLCGVDILVVAFSPVGKLVLQCGSQTTVEKVLQRFARTSPQERTNSRDENLKQVETIVANLNAKKKYEDESADGDPRPEEDSELEDSEMEDMESTEDMKRVCIESMLDGPSFAPLSGPALQNPLMEIAGTSTNGAGASLRHEFLPESMPTVMDNSYLQTPQHFQAKLPAVVPAGLPAQANGGERLQFEEEVFDVGQLSGATPVFEWADLEFPELDEPSEAVAAFQSSDLEFPELDELSEAESPLPRMMAVRERRLTEQREVVAKQQESECLTGRLKQSQPLEDLIMTRVKESASLAELDDLENSIRTRLSKVQESKQNLRRQEIENELIEILQSSPLPKECYPFSEATNKAGTSLLQSLPMLTPTPDNPKDWSPFAEPTDEAETSLLQSLPMPTPTADNSKECSPFAEATNEAGTSLLQSLLMPTPTPDNSKECSPFAEATNEAGTSLLQSLPMPTPTLMDNPYLQHLNQMEQTHSTVGQRLLSATSLLKSFVMSTSTLMDNPYLQHLHQMQQAHSTVGQRLLSLNGKHIVNFGQASGVGADERIMPSKPVLDFYLSTIPKPYGGEVV